MNAISQIEYFVPFSRCAAWFYIHTEYYDEKNYSRTELAGTKYGGGQYSGTEGSSYAENHRCKRN